MVAVPRTGGTHRAFAAGADWADVAGAGVAGLACAKTVELIKREDAAAASNVNAERDMGASAKGTY